MLELNQYAKLLIGLAAIVNPVGAVPIFVGLTENRTPRQRRRIGSAAAVATGLILLVCLFAGETLLRLFGITIHSFRIAGGLLILLTALSLLHAGAGRGAESANEHDAAGHESVALVPLAMPLLAGPGAISTVIVYAHRHESTGHYLLISAAIVSVALIVFAALRLAPAIATRLGRTGMHTITRVMGLVMAAIAVEFIVDGLAVLFPGWG